MKRNSNAPVRLLYGEDCTRKAKAAGCICAQLHQSISCLSTCLCLSNMINAICLFNQITVSAVSI